VSWINGLCTTMTTVPPMIAQNHTSFISSRMSY